MDIFCIYLQNYLLYFNYIRHSLCIPYILKGYSQLRSIFSIICENRQQTRMKGKLVFKWYIFLNSLSYLWSVYCDKMNTCRQTAVRRKTISFLQQDILWSFLSLAQYTVTSLSVHWLRKIFNPADFDKHK